jgi:RNA polymerase subunit RPABC4/transcription elongation factor Spt4
MSCFSSEVVAFHATSLNRNKDLQDDKEGYTTDVVWKRDMNVVLLIVRFQAKIFVRLAKTKLSHNMKIICSNCGETIPFSGKVCPHCHHDKSEDQEKEVIIQVTLFSGAAVGLVSGMITYAISSIGPALIAGGILGCITMVALYNSYNSLPPKDPRN